MTSYERDRTDLGLSELPDTIADLTGPHRCENGWTLPHDPDRPRPCPTCRPHLVRETRQGVTVWHAKRTGRK